MIKEIYLIRHSIADKNSTLDNKDIPLSDEGNSKALELSKLDELSNLDIVVASEYKRAIETAKYLINNDCKFVIDNNFNERVIGGDINESFWINQHYDDNLKNNDGESNSDVRTRMLNGINKILSDDSIKRCAIVTHGAAMTFLLMNWCTLEELDSSTKRRKLSFNGNIVFNDTIKSPCVFKLVFNNNKLIEIKRTF